MNETSNILKTKSARYKLAALLGIGITAVILAVASLFALGNQAKATDENGAEHFTIGDVEAEDLAAGTVKVSITAKDGRFLLTNEDEDDSISGVQYKGWLSNGVYESSGDALAACNTNGFPVQNNKSHIKSTSFGSLHRDITVSNLQLDEDYDDSAGQLDTSVLYHTSADLEFNVNPNETGDKRYLCIQVPGVVFDKNEAFAKNDDSKYQFSEKNNLLTDEVKQAFADVIAVDAATPYARLDASKSVKAERITYHASHSGDIDIYKTYSIVVVPLPVKKDLRLTSNTGIDGDDLKIEFSLGEKYISAVGVRAIPGDSACSNTAIRAWNDNAATEIDGSDLENANTEDTTVRRISDYLSEIDVGDNLCFKITTITRTDVAGKDGLWVNEGEARSDGYAYLIYRIGEMIDDDMDDDDDGMDNDGMDGEDEMTATTEAKLTITKTEKSVIATANSPELVDTSTIQYVTMPITDIYCKDIDFSTAVKDGHYGGVDGDNIKEYDVNLKPMYKDNVDYCFRAKVKDKATNGDDNDYIYGYLNQGARAPAPAPGGNEGGTTTPPTGGQTDGGDDDDTTQEPVNNTPSISISQEADSNDVIISASNADGIDGTSWVYIGPLDNDPGDCDADDFAANQETELSADANSGSATLTLDDDSKDKFYCVRVSTTTTPAEQLFQRIAVDSEGQTGSQSGDTDDGTTDPDDGTNDGTTDPDGEDGGSNVGIFVIVGVVIVVVIAVVLILVSKKSDN